MSIKIMSQVWEHADCKGSELLLLLALADSANDEGICWPSLPTLSKKTRMGRRYVINLINSLVEKGWVERIDTAGEKYKNSTVYKITQITKEQAGGEPQFTPPVNPGSPPSEPQFTPPVNPGSPNPLINRKLIVKEPPLMDVVNIFKLYEGSIGAVTKFISEELTQAEQDYPASWLPKAFKIAEEQNVRKWSYVKGILKRWQKEGFVDKVQEPETKIISFEPIME